MNRTVSAALLAFGLMVAAPVNGAQQPPPAAVPPAAPVAPVERPVVPIDERSARDVRQRLQEMFREYPPSLEQILRLDPSLLTREGYLAPYPMLEAFIAQHPDVVRHPSFYLGPPEPAETQEDARSRTVRMAGDVLETMVVLGGFVAFFITISWLARLLVDHRRWLRAEKTQNEVHAKLFDRLTSNEDLLAYLQSPAGVRFLQPAPMPADASPRAVAAPISRILWSVQAGTVLAVVGVGLWFVKNTVMYELSGPLNVVAVLTIALGLGFTMSAGVSYLLSRRLGLLDSPRV
jgi:hypothetical protein